MKSYPFLFRTCYSVDAWISPQITVVKYYKWTKVATLTRRSDLYDQVSLLLLYLMDGKLSNCQYHPRYVFISNHLANKTELIEILYDKHV